MLTIFLVPSTTNITYFFAFIRLLCWLFNLLPHQQQPVLLASSLRSLQQQQKIFLALRPAACGRFFTSTSLCASSLQLLLRFYLTLRQRSAAASPLPPRSPPAASSHFTTFTSLSASCLRSPLRSHLALRQLSPTAIHLPASSQPAVVGGSTSPPLAGISATSPLGARSSARKESSLAVSQLLLPLAFFTCFTSSACLPHFSCFLRSTSADYSFSL